MKRKPAESIKNATWQLVDYLIDYKDLTTEDSIALDKEIAALVTKVEAIKEKTAIATTVNAVPAV